MLTIKLTAYRLLCKTEDDYIKYATKLNSEYPKKISFYMAYKRLKSEV